MTSMPISWFIFYNLFMLSSKLRKAMLPLFYAASSYSKLKVLFIFSSQPQSPLIDSQPLLNRVFIFFLQLRFQYFKEPKNQIQQLLISEKIFLMFQSHSSFLVLSFISINLYLYCYKYTIIISLNIYIQMMSKKIWLDCDPGHDDMLAIIMAAMSEEIQLIGVSTSAGNSTIENTTQNALNILYEIGKSHIKVVKGASCPLVHKLHTAEDIHGQSGLEGATLQKSPEKAIEQNSFIEIYNSIMNVEGKIDFVVTGAMTNLAILLKAFPGLKNKINSVVVMGGAIGLGNWSPAAQFNILVDPEAAQIVVDSALPLTFVPLQLTHTVLVTQEVFDELSKLQSSFGKKLGPLFRYFQKSYKVNQDFDYPVAHDPCTIHYLLHPEDFTVKTALTKIELEGFSRGRTNFSFMNHVANSNVCMTINVKNFWFSMIKCLRKIK